MKSRAGIAGIVAFCGLLSLFWGFSARPAEALTVRAVVDRDRIAVGESVELRIVMTDGSGDVDTSPIGDFDVLYRGQASSIQIVNGDVRRELTKNYRLTPRRQGTLRIPPLPVRSGSDTVRTSPIVIYVGGPSAAATDSGADDLLLTASVSAARPYVGQEIVYTFRFMAAVPVTNARYQRPAFDGFAVTEIDGQKEYDSIRNGRRFSVTEVSYLLTPTRSGELTIAPGVISCDVRAPGDAGRGRLPSLFDDPFFGRFHTVRRTVRSPAIPVAVRPLPPWRGEGTFSGLIGHFTLSASLDPTELAAGDSATVELKLSGTGNVQDAPEPPFESPPGTKVYPDNPETTVTEGPDGTRGSRTFRYAVVPIEAGERALGPFAYNVFDPETGVYRTIRAGALTLTVRPSGAAAPERDRTVGDEPAGRNRVRVRDTGHDILTVHADLGALRSVPSPDPLLFTILLLLPPVAGLFGRGLARRRGRRRSDGERMRERALGLLRPVAGNEDDDAILGRLHRALVAAVFARLGRAGESLTHAEARRWLEDAGCDPDTVQELLGALAEVEAARYGGGRGETGRPAARVGAVVRRLVAAGRSR